MFDVEKCASFISNVERYLKSKRTLVAVYFVVVHLWSSLSLVMNYAYNIHTLAWHWVLKPRLRPRLSRAAHAARSAAPPDKSLYFSSVYALHCLLQSPTLHYERIIECFILHDGPTLTKFTSTGQDEIYYIVQKGGIFFPHSCMVNKNLLMSCSRLCVLLFKYPSVSKLIMLTYCFRITISNFTL